MELVPDALVNVSKPLATCPTPAPGCVGAPVHVPAAALLGVQQGAQTRQERFQVRMYIANALQVPH